MTLRFLPDTPIQTAAEDLLQFSPFVNLLRRSLLRTEPPFVYGILGDWGSGKTSILRMLQGQLSVASSRENTFIPIWVNARTQENRANPIYPLLHALKQQYDLAARGGAAGNGFVAKFKQVTATSALALNGDVLQAVSRQTSEQLLGGGEGTDRETGQPRAVERLVRSLAGWTESAGQVEDQFAALLAAYADDVARWRQIDPASVRFVILIDDLDRCQPPTAISLLDSIKSHLSVDRCAFILALNPGLINHSIRAVYPHLTMDSRAYLETILNYAFPVPEATAARVKAFTSTRLDFLARDPAVQSRYRPSFETFGAVLADCRFSNPRRIKRVLNRYLFFLAHYEQANDLQPRLDEFNLSNIVRLIVLAEYFPVLFELLYSLPYPHQLLDGLSAKTTYAQWEQRYGLTIPADYPPLARLRALFELSPNQNFRMELEAVYQIAYLMH